MGRFKGKFGKTQLCAIPLNLFSSDLNYSKPQHAQKIFLMMMVISSAKARLGTDYHDKITDIPDLVHSSVVQHKQHCLNMIVN